MNFNFDDYTITSSKLIKSYTKLKRLEAVKKESIKYNNSKNGKLNNKPESGKSNKKDVILEKRENFSSEDSEEGSDYSYSELTQELDKNNRTNIHLNDLKNKLNLYNDLTENFSSVKLENNSIKQSEVNKNCKKSKNKKTSDFKENTYLRIYSNTFCDPLMQTGIKTKFSNDKKENKILEELDIKDLIKNEVDGNSFNEIVVDNDKKQIEEASDKNKIESLKISILNPKFNIYWMKLFKLIFGYNSDFSKIDEFIMNRNEYLLRQSVQKHVEEKLIHSQVEKKIVELQNKSKEKNKRKSVKDRRQTVIKKKENALNSSTSLSKVNGMNINNLNNSNQDSPKSNSKDSKNENTKDNKYVNLRGKFINLMTLFKSLANIDDVISEYKNNIQEVYKCKNSFSIYEIKLRLARFKLYDEKEIDNMKVNNKPQKNVYDFFTSFENHYKTFAKKEKSAFKNRKLEGQLKENETFESSDNFDSKNNMLKIIDEKEIINNPPSLRKSTKIKTKLSTINLKNSKFSSKNSFDENFGDNLNKILEIEEDNKSKKDIGDSSFSNSYKVIQTKHTNNSHYNNNNNKNDEVKVKSSLKKKENNNSNQGLKKVGIKHISHARNQNITIDNEKSSESKKFHSIFGFNSNSINNEYEHDTNSKLSKSFENLYSDKVINTIKVIDFYDLDEKNNKKEIDIKDSNRKTKFKIPASSSIELGIKRNYSKSLLIPTNRQSSILGKRKTTENLKRESRIKFRKSEIIKSISDTDMDNTIPIEKDKIIEQCK